MKEKKTDMKYYIGILVAVTLAIGAVTGISIGAADDAEIDEITKTVSMDTVVEHMEARGFDVTVEDNQISAYKEGFGRTVTITHDCPDGECQFQKPEGMNDMGFGKKHFRFRMHGDMDMGAVKAKMEAMGYNMESMEAKMAGMGCEGPEDCPMKARMAEMNVEGFKGCPMQAMLEQEAEE